MKLIEVFKKIKVWKLYVWNTCMETICMEYLYGNLSFDVWKLSQIPHYLGLCRKNPNKGVFGWSKFSFEG